MKQIRIWVLVADSARARAVRWMGIEAPLEQVEGLELGFEHQHVRDMLADRAGRVHESQGAARHGVQPHTDPVRNAEHRFAEKVAAAMQERLAKGELDKLILVAGPTMLGDLRKAMSPQLAAAIKGELAKDLTHLPNAELKRHLQDAGLVPA